MRAKSAMTRKPNIDRDLDYQNQKYKVLQQDRKNFLRQAQEIKEKNKEEIDKLKAQNRKLKSIRDEFISSKKNKGLMMKSSYNSTFGSSGQINISNCDENYLRRLLDKERHNTKIKKSALFTLQDKLKEVEDNKLGYIEESPLMRNIRILENRLDKVMTKQNKAQAIQQTYEQVVKKLKKERVGYNSQLAAVEISLKGKEHDFEELLLLAHDATHAKEVAHAEIKRFEQRRITIQEMRSKYLNDKNDEIKKQIPQNQEAAQKTEKNYTNNQKQPANFTNLYKTDENYQKQELNDYEDTFRMLKEVTGVIDANEIIQKFKTQGLTTNSLKELKENYKKKIEDLKEEKEELKKMLEQKKLMKESGQGHRRRLDEIEADSAKVTNQYERINLKYQKLSNSLINIKAGIQHIKEMTLFYKRESEFSSSNSIEQDLKTINEKCRRMYDVLKNDANYIKHHDKASVAAIQSMMNEQAEYKNYNQMDEDEVNSDNDD